MSSKDGQFKQYNGTNWDDLNPKTKWDLITGKPTNYPPSAHTHDEYLEKTGGTMTSGINFKYSNSLKYSPSVYSGYNYRDGIKTGMLTIYLPHFNAAIYPMIKFTVSVYNHYDETSVDYVISGYAYHDNGLWYSTTALAIGKSVYANLPIKFYQRDDNGRFKIGIGNSDTTWYYPQVVIKDVLIGYDSNDLDWSTGWDIEITQTDFGTPQGTFSNTGFLPLDGGSLYGSVYTQQIYPTSNNSYDLGSSSQQWRYIYGSAIYENGTSLESKYVQIANAVKYGGNQTGIGSSSPASGAKSWATSANLPNGNALIYNSAGAEYSLLYSFRPDALGNGAILKWGYPDKYMRILRRAGDWQSTDWEKISAGYADAAGASDYSNTSAGLIQTSRLGDGENKLQYSQYDGATDNPTNDWYSHIIMHHGNQLGYYTEMATCFHSDNVYFRRKEAGVVKEWFRIANASDLNNYLPLSGGTIASTSGDAPLAIQSKSGASWLQFKNSSGVGIGFLGINASQQPCFFDTGEKRLALYSDIGNATLTIQAEGTTIDTFTANATSDKTINITASALGLSGALKFLGTTTTALSDGATTNPITVGGSSVTVANGNVVIYGNKEFLWNGSSWEELGDESSYALKSVTITGTGALTGGGSLEQNRTIGLNSGGADTVSIGLWAFGTDAYSRISSVRQVIASDIPDLSGIYLPLSGGTIAASSGNAPLTIKPATGYSNVFIGFQNPSGANLGWYGVNVSNKTPIFLKSGESNANELALAKDYLPLAGGTLTGKLGFTNNDITRYDFVTNGYWSYSDTTATGMILITLPENIYSRMIKFKVSIFNYSTQTSCEFSIGGYPYADGNWYNTFAYCEGNGDISKLPVNFFVKDSNNRFKVGIGSINTTWSYPKVYIKDVEIGHNDGSTLGNGWSITIVDTQPAEAYSSYSNTGFLPLAGGIIGSGGTGTNDSSDSAKLEVDGGIIKIKNFSNTFSIGQRNPSFVHFENTNGATFYFGNQVTVAGMVYPYTDDTYYLGGANNQWNRIYGKTIYEGGTALSGKYLERLAWWQYEDTSKNVDDLISGTTFAYQAVHNCPTTGPIVAFASRTVQAYGLQLQGCYGESGNKLYFRTNNGDTQTWNDWKEIIHTGNISSYLNNYLPLSGGTLSGTLYSRSIVPAVNNSYNLGTSDYKYNAIYGTNILANYSEVNTTLQVSFPNYATLISAGYLRSDYESAGYPTEDFCKAICRWAINSYPNKGDIELIGFIAPNSTGTCILHLYSSSGKDSSNNPRYCSGIYLHLSGASFRFGFSDYNWYYIALASTGDLNNYLSLSGGNMSGNINFGDNTRRIGQQDGSTLTRYNGNTVTLPSANGKGVAILADEGGDFGLLFVGSDGAVLANSGDTGYIFKVYDKDQNSSDFTSSSGLAFGVKQAGGGVYAQGNFEASGDIYENGTSLASKYAAASHTHNTIVGGYTYSQEKPNFFGVNKVGALMMNTTINGNSQYKDWLFMDCYSGNDVGGAVAIGVNRQSLGLYIMRSEAARNEWHEGAELIGTHNIGTYVKAWAQADNKPSYTLDEVSDGSTRKLADKLDKSAFSLSGTTLTLTL